MSAPIVLVGKYHQLGAGFSTQEKVAALEHPGRRRDGVQTAASWIADLTDLRIPVVLCGFCRSRFPYKKHGYRVRWQPDYSGKTDGTQVSGRCVACKQPTVNTPGNGICFTPAEHYRDVYLDPHAERRRHQAIARQQWGVMTFTERMRAATTALRSWASRRAREASAPPQRGA